MVVLNQNFAIRQGQTKRVNITITDEETGSPLVIADQNFTVHILNDRTSTTPVRVYQRTIGIEVIGSTTGRIRWTIPAAQSATLTARHYYYILWVVTTAGVKTPALEGKMEVVRAGPGV